MKRRARSSRAFEDKFILSVYLGIVVIATALIVAAEQDVRSATCTRDPPLATADMVWVRESYEQSQPVIQ